MIKIKKFYRMNVGKKDVYYKRYNNFSCLYIYLTGRYYVIDFPMPRLFINEFDTKHQLGRSVPTRYHKFFIKLKQLTSKFK